MESSKARQAILGIATRYLSGGANRYHPERLQTMDDILYAMAEVDLAETDVFIHTADAPKLDKEPPKIFAYFKDGENKPTFLHEILDFPIAYSFAVYPKLQIDESSRTPMLWTRGLHNYKSFGASYTGHIAFLDGHVVSFSGEPGQHEPELEYWFGEDSIYQDALRIIEHVPRDWSEAAPLPVRFETFTRQKRVHSRILETLRFFLLPLVVAVPVAIFGRKPMIERITRGIVAYVVVWLLLAVLIPSV